MGMTSSPLPERDLTFEAAAWLDEAQHALEMARARVLVLEKADG
jgi:hypothetical protein